MRIDLPRDVNYIIETLYSNGYEAYAVGGCVRDTLLGRTPKDWDITTSAKPEEVKALFNHTIDTGILHGTVTVMLNHEGYEVTTYRIDGEYEDARHPKEVTFTANLVEDLKRRDFTINAMAYNHKVGLVDEFDGVKDLENKIIRCVGNPMDRFSEDALRMLRAVRFAAQLGFSIEDKTQEAVKALAPTIKKVSAERIQVELVKLVTSEHPDEMRTVYELGLTKIFMPEFDTMMETKQLNKHHMYTVGEHSIQSMLNIRADKVLRLTMLLHDVGKPQCRSTGEDGQEHYYNHPKVGADISKDILKRLKFDNDTIDRCYKLILYHDDRPAMTQRSIRKSISKIGLQQYPSLFEVKYADTMAQSMYKRDEKLNYLEEYKAIFKDIIDSGQCVEKKSLAIGGKELMEIGMKPGKEMGLVLEKLYEKVLEEPEMNTEENLIEYAHKIITSLI
ncbi:MAG: CCA tRNA nucleotidyltransferase [Agathobacter sp.]|nr:CCA tRNA nucleotidyltransferase [Agathobacter sp.]